MMLFLVFIINEAVVTPTLIPPSSSEPPKQIPTESIETKAENSNSETLESEKIEIADPLKSKIPHDLMDEVYEKTRQEAIEDRKRQKKEMEEARKRLREQMQRDKLERALAKEDSKHYARDTNLAPDECRIQARFPDGNILVEKFKVDSTLQEIVDAIK